MESQPKTILLIDDEKTLLFGLSVMVKKAGFNVLTANNGTDALRLAKTEQPDLIVSDVTMPPPNGFELRAIFSSDPDLSSIPFIFLTSHGSKSDKLRGLRSGADDYVTKPVSYEELVARIQAVLRRVALERRQERNLMQGEIKELREQILGNVTLELRSPLSLVLQTLEMSLMDRFSQDRQKQKKFIQAALNNAYRLEKMIEDLIALIQMDQGTVNNFRQVLSIERDFYPLVKFYRKRYAKRRFRMTARVVPGVVIYASQGGFKHAVGHLIDNACKFSPEKGHIDISLTRNGQGGCILTITDRGRGIPLELHEKVFERFYQINQPDTLNNEGLGLGLTIARAFARGLGGDVVLIEQKKGCQVQMTLPPPERSSNTF